MFEKINMFVRTRNGISDVEKIINAYRVKEEELIGGECFFSSLEDIKNLYQTSENVEDLFDEVVMVDLINKPLISTLWKNGDLKEQAKKIFIDSLKVSIRTYGAIWTENGLIYVAKMNEEGGFDLL